MPAAASAKEATKRRDQRELVIDLARSYNMHHNPISRLAAWRGFKISSSSYRSSNLSLRGYVPHETSSNSPPERKRNMASTSPKKTLILLPDVNPHSLRWGLGKAGDREGMQISGNLQATNTSKYHIRAAGIRLVEPIGVEVITQMVTVNDVESGTHSYQHLILTRSIGEISFMFFVVPVKGTQGKTLTAAVAVLDQFGNEHVIGGLEFKYVGPMP
jgi:hypothetical protein